MPNIVLPFPGEPAWNTKLNTAISAVNAATDALTTTVTTATNSFVGTLGAQTVFIGDSITAGSSIWNTAGQFQEFKSQEWPTYAEILSQGRIIMVKNASVGGNTSAQMLARFDADVTPLNPKTVVIAGGVNDVAQGRPMADWMTDTVAMVAKTRAIGARPVLGALFTMQTSALTITANIWNLALRQYAEAQNIPVIGFDQLADPVTGTWPLAWTTVGDRVHPAFGEGQGSLGRRFVADLAPLFGAPKLALPQFNSYGVFTNGFFTTPNALAPGTQPVGVSATGAAGGSLPQGEYQYAAAARTFDGYTLASVPITATAVPAAGKVTFVLTGDNNDYAIYRRRNLDPWVMLTQATLTVVPRTFVDSGTLTPVRTDDPPTVDSTRLPAGWEGVANQHLSYVAPNPNVRGYMLRQNANALGVIAKTTTVPCVAGQVWELIGKVRKDLGITATITAEMLNASAVNVVRVRPLNSLLSSLDWGIFSTRFTVPLTATQIKVQLSAVGDATESKFVDWAEIDLRKIS